MANAAMNIEKTKKYEMITMVHDEALAECEIGMGNLKEFVKLMIALPAWAEGAPVTAEGWQGPRYRK